ncbi:hypothetical protein ACS0TY_010168 [Phlomoides rotata]
MKKLEDKNENLIDTLKTYEAIDDHKGDTAEKKTPHEKMTRSKSVVKPSTLIKRVKERTQKEKRKSIEIIPQMNTGELIAIGDKKRNVELPWDEKCLAVRRTLSHIKALIIDYWNVVDGWPDILQEKYEHTDVGKHSVDCGVIVCMNMENELLQKKETKKVLSSNASAEYMKKIVE